MAEGRNVLRLATYMCPSLPVEYYELLAEYLEAELEMQTILIYNSRRYGPDLKREDDKHIDLAFISTSTYLDEYKRNCDAFKLLEVGAVTKHPLKGNVLGYFTDIVAHKDFKERKNFMDLRGCKYVFANKNSLSSIQQVLLKLKQLGESVSFFNSIKESGNHMNSIEQVISKRAEVTAVDSLSLSNYLSRHYYQVSELHLFESWGPLPPHPIMINTKVTGELKTKIELAFLDILKSSHWREQLASFSVSGFRQTSCDSYLETLDLLDSTKSLTIEETQIREGGGKILRLATYMCPSLPVEYYKLIAEYLESKLDRPTVLIINSRQYGPDVKRGDDKYIDIAFISTLTYMNEYKRNWDSFKLLEVGAVTKHPLKGNVLGYYTDIVTHKDLKGRKNFMDLRGCKYVFANKNSMSSNQQVLLKLKQLGESISFFSNIKESGSHTNSIEQVIKKRAEVTAVDSLSLSNYSRSHCHQTSDLHLFESWGPLPPHPIIFNTKMPREMKTKIEMAFLDIQKSSHWREKLAKFSVSGFSQTSCDSYLETSGWLNSAKSLKIEETYY